MSLSRAGAVERAGPEPEPEPEPEPGGAEPECGAGTRVSEPEIVDTLK